MRLSLRGVCAVCALLTAAPLSTPAVDVSINTSQALQTIDGFGFFGPQRVWWGSSNPSDFYSDAWLTLVLRDLGITIWRNEYYSEETNQDANWAKQRPAVVALKAKADALGVPLKFIYTVWTPPSRWKDNTSLKNGGHLLSQYYPAFGTWLAQGVRNYAGAGIALYGLSPQNELLFSEPYNSCVYTIAEYRDMLKVAGPIVHDSFPDVKIFGPEHMLFGVGKDWDWNNLDPSQAVLTDAAANAQLGFWACHGYGADGQTPTAASEEATFWQKARQRVGPYNKPMWMTETSGYDNSWAGALDYVMSMHAALFYGRLNGWVHWYGIDDLVTATALTRKGFAARHYFRYVRPGATALSVTVQSDAEVLATAFRHSGENSFTVVVINSGAAAKTLNLTGTGLPASFQLLRTSVSENCVAGGTVTASGISLPASSIITLYYQGQNSIRRPAGRTGLRPGAASAPQTAYRLDGGVAGRPPCGRGVYVLADAAGRCRPAAYVGRN